MLGHVFHRSAMLSRHGSAHGLLGREHGATKTQSTSGMWVVNQLEGEQKEDFTTCGAAGGHCCGLLGLLRLSGASGAS